MHAPTSIRPLITRLVGAPFAVLALLACLCHAAIAAPELTAKVASFPFGAGRFCVDPVRPRIYATDIASNSVHVINTETLTIEGTISVGPGPSAMAISSDHAKLYVAHPSEHYLSEINLDDTRQQRRLSLPFAVYDVEAGSNNTLYVSTVPYTGWNTAPLNRLDASTGEVLRGFGSGSGRYTLEISPDRQTLYVGALHTTGGFLSSFDISVPKPALLQRVTNFDYDNEARGLILSHDGSFLCYSLGLANRNSTYRPSIALFTADLRIVKGIFPYPIGEHPRHAPKALSPDDSVAYQIYEAPVTATSVILRSTATFRELNRLQITDGSDSVTASLSPITTDRTGQYLFFGHGYQVFVYDVAPRLETVKTLAGLLGAPLSYQVRTTFDATGFSATSLPPGLHINHEGLISGTPTAPGTFVTTVSATRGAIRASRTFTINIDEIQLQNISTRAYAQAYDRTLVGGFIVEGTVPKEVVVRIIGTSLKGNGMVPYLDPVLRLYDARGIQRTYNDDWGASSHDEPQNRLRSLGLAPTEPAESAVIVSLEPGAYTVVVEGGGGGLITKHVGMALFEVYDIDADRASRLANVSSRAFVGPYTRVAIAGIIVGGAGRGNVLFRAVGPSLGAEGVTEPLADPLLELHNGDGTLLSRNDNWQETQKAEIEATQIAPSDPAEPAILTRLGAGVYTAVLRGVGVDGIALIEAYHIPDRAASELQRPQ